MDTRDLKLFSKRVNNIIQEEVKGIPHINDGGCGLFAYYLYHLLVKYYPVILIAHKGKIGYHHCGIELYGHFIDADGMFTSEEYTVNRHHAYEDYFRPISSAKLLHDIYDRWHWNKKFNFQHRHRLHKVCFRISKRIRDEIQ